MTVDEHCYWHGFWSGWAWVAFGVYELPPTHTQNQAWRRGFERGVQLTKEARTLPDAPPANDHAHHVPAPPGW